MIGALARAPISSGPEWLPPAWTLTAARPDWGSPPRRRLARRAPTAAEKHGGHPTLALGAVVGASTLLEALTPWLVSSRFLILPAAAVVGIAYLLLLALSQELGARELAYVQRVMGGRGGKAGARTDAICALAAAEPAAFSFRGTRPA